MDLQFLYLILEVSHLKKNWYENLEMPYNFPKWNKKKFKIQDKLVILDIAAFIVLESNSNFSVPNDKSFLQ